MAARTSRRRVLQSAAALAVAAMFRPLEAVRGVRAQAGTPEAALAQLFSAGQADPNWFSPTILQKLPIGQLQSEIDGIKGLLGGYQAVQANGDGTFSVMFEGGSAQVRAALDDQGRIAALGVLGIDYALAGDEQEIQFQSGSDTLYGTLLVPAGTMNPPAALLIAGSGPTDRNGNSPLTTARPDTLANIARTLADAGLASLRYDKFGAGKTGTAGRAPTDVDFNIFTDEAAAAYAALAARPELDATRLLIAGHSEGGLLALILAQQVQSTQPPDALLLAAPLGQRFLDVLRRQLAAQFDAALAAKLITSDVHDSLIAGLDRTIASIRASGTLPSDVFTQAPPALAQLLGESFPAYIGPYEQQEDSYDPAQVAASLPAALPVLILHGALDRNVNEDDIQHLLAGFQAGGNTTVQVDEFPDVNLELQQVTSTAAPSSSPPFSPDVAAAITAFVLGVFA